MDGSIDCVMCVCLIGCIQGADCSGRTLATLLVLWVATLMVTSILLNWSYMWIVLTVLTLLFLIVCACMAYIIKRAQMRTWASELSRGADERRRRERGAVWTISGITVDNCRERESQQVVDLPPSYALVMSAQPTSESARQSSAIGDPSDGSKFEDPPPYASVISFADACDRNAEAVGEPNAISSASPEEQSTMPFPHPGRHSPLSKNECYIVDT